MLSVGSKPPTPSLDLLRSMAGVLAHRGPDDEGFYAEGPVGLAFRRLAIIDLPGGRQPMGADHCRGKGLRVVFNGEIYNYRALRDELRALGHRFATASDTEVLLHGYEEWGERLPEKLLGMFAFALWDGAARTLLLARDRVGKKPLYWAAEGGVFYFASEIKALLKALPRSPEIDPQAIHSFLAYQYIPGPRTIYKGVERLSPAHSLRVMDNGERRLRRYWQTPAARTTMDYQSAKERLLELLRRAVRDRLESDVPLGAFLSGGVDSSAVVGLMAEASSRPVKTFAVGFGERGFDELPFARRVAERFGTEHTELRVRAEMMSVLPRLAWLYDQPFADSSALPSYFVARETRRHVTVALNGDGGDENFGGYLRYGFLALMTRCPRPLRAAVGAFAAACPERFLSRRLGRRVLMGLRQWAKTTEEANLALIETLTQVDKNELYSDDFKSLTGDRVAEDYYRGLQGQGDPRDSLGRVINADIQGYLPEDLLVKMDVASMANSLEARSPFLDHRLLEFASCLPTSWKTSPLKTKRILKEALMGFLPPEVLGRRKQGFGAPVAQWLQGPWHGTLRRMLLSPEALGRGYFRRDSLERLLVEHRRGVKDNGNVLWALLQLEIWHRVWTDKTLSPDEPLTQ